jgi:hypothetical protein
MTGACGMLVSDDGLVARVAPAASKPFNIVWLLTIAGERNGVKKGFLKLFFECLIAKVRLLP